MDSSYTIILYFFSVEVEMIGSKDYFRMVKDLSFCTNALKMADLSGPGTVRRQNNYPADKLSGY